MKIHGLQKMTLLDFPGHVACTVFLGGCDFRCPFCHNFELVDGSAPAILEEDELLGFLAKRRGLLDGVAFTGGEPCMRKDLPELLRKVRELGFAVKLDTNGNHPEVLRQILEEGLAEYVAMDVKNSPEKYALTVGLGTADDRMDLSRIQESMRLLAESGIDYEFRTTVIDELHTADDFEAIRLFAGNVPHFYLQAFTDRDSVPFGGFHAPSRENMEKYAEILRKSIPDVQIRGMD